MECSAHSLTSTFQALALQSWQRPADIALRQTVGRLGREGEQQMMAATGGVNTHRGAIWALGLLVSAVAMLGGDAGRKTSPAPPHSWRDCRTTRRRRCSVKACAPRTVTACRARVKRRSRRSRTLCSARCRSFV